MSGCIKVFARVRPAVSSDCDPIQCISVENGSLKTTGTVSNDEFEFEKVFGPNNSTRDLFLKCVEPLYTQWKKGTNVSILCYGQTCSGKTFTSFGTSHCLPESSKDPGDPGIAQMIISELFKDIQRSSVPIRVYGSLIEIYNEKTFDLLSDPDSGEVKATSIRENKRGQFVIPNLIKQKLSSLSDAYELLQKGHEQKRFGNSALHDRSSRSHTIFRLYIARPSRDTGQIVLSELNLVDLAGSEVLSYEFGEQQQAETKHINLSLLALKRVMNSLAQSSKHIPYRQSSLTKILQNSLGGNSLTSLLCMVSPCLLHWPVSQRTLGFGQIVQTIKLSVEPLQQQKPSFHDDADLKTSCALELTEVKCNESNEKKKQKIEVYDIIQLIETSAGEVAVHELRKTKKNKKCESLNPMAIILHAHSPGCGGLDWDYLFAPLLSAGYTVIAPDFPGFQESAHLPRVGSRTEDQDNYHGSPVDVLNEIIKYYGNKRIILLGYDWGGGLAVSYSLKYPKRILRIVMFHPSWTMPLAPLNKVKTRILILWVPVEQLHVYSRGVKMAKAIPHCTFIKCSIGAYSNSKAAGYYHSIGDRISNLILDFLPPIQTPNPKPTTKIHNLSQPIQSEKATQNERNKKNEKNENLMDDSELDALVENMINSSSFLPDITEKRKQSKERKANLKEKRKLKTCDAPPDSCSELERTHWAVERFIELHETGELEKMYQAYFQHTPERPAAVRLFGSLPVFDPQKLTLYDMVNLLIWPEKILQFDVDVESCPRYLPGRKVLVRAPVIASLFMGDDYLSYDKDSNHKIITHRAMIHSQDPKEKNSFLVAVELPIGHYDKHEIISVDKKHILDINEPTKFRIEAEGYLFEDKIHCKYSELITRAKLMEVALVIRKLISNEDTIISNDNYILQMNCMREIWKTIDLTHFDHVGLHPTRFSRPHVGRLSYFGQGNCHTLASVLAAFLLPFGKILGWEVTFRAGFFYKFNGRDGEGFDGIPRDIDDHTWLEVTLLPSLKRFVCDPSFDEICIPLEEAYSVAGCRHPSGKPQCQSTSK